MNKWDRAVKEAGELTRLLKLKTQHRMRVAELALDACSVEVGGRRSVEQVTIVKFAKAINLHEKTLYEWIHMWRLVFEKLTNEQREAALDAPFDYVRNVRQQVSTDDEPEKVQALFQTEMTKPRTAHTFKKYIKHVRSVLYNAKEPKRLAEVTDDDLKEMVSLCGLIQGALDRELRFRSEWSAKRFEAPREINGAEVWSEVLR